MASIISGFEYDIFISYRQKDNKGDRWVSQFVDALKTELESTFKENVSVYFDENPHDGLLEIHDVDKSLEGKLKCLIFIPIISQTYCDPKSFAWQHEFCVFNKMAREDSLGLDVKLRGGNVASRILPVKINDLDPEDNELLEKELGGFLRAIEFIYKEPGINRPLTPCDDHKSNLNRTSYRNQINKVAHAIKEIILGIKSGTQLAVKEETGQKMQAERVMEKFNLAKKAKTGKRAWQNILSVIFIAVALILAGMFLYPKLFKGDRMEILRKKGQVSVAVMPFQNLTNDATRNFWEVMIQNNLITSLSNVRELKIRQTESVLSLLDNADLTTYVSLTPALARSVSQKLDANVFVHGSINQVGNVTRLNAKLIDSKTDEVFKSFQIDGSPENILYLSDSLSMIIRDYLIIEMLKKEFYPDLWKGESSNSPEAIRFFIEGLKYFRAGNFPKAIESFFRSIEVDPDYIEPKLWLPSSFGNQGLFEEAKKWTRIVNENKDQLSRKERLRAEYLYAMYFGTPNDVIIILRQRLEFDDHSPIDYYLLGLFYNYLDQYEKAIPEYERALEIYKNWGVKPSWAPNYSALGTAYHKTGQYRKEQRLYKQAVKDFPDDPSIILRQAILALVRGKTKQADEYLVKLESFTRNQGASEASVQHELAWVFDEAGKTDQAEKHLRNALLLEPQSPVRINNLAFHLINRNLNIDEGMDLVNKALEMQPENFYFLHTKGLGLYKQGKYQEALEILQQSWDLRLERARYNHEAFLHLEEAKKAVASNR